MSQKLKPLVAAGLVALCLFLGAFTSARWQNHPVLEKIMAKLTAYQQSYPQEKVYLHLDKPYYAAGDDIWLKAYLVDAAHNAPSQLSQVLYVELINAQDSVHQRLALNLQNGVGHGDFALPDTLADGLYRLRAYTSWMQNFDQDYFFHQNLPIYNPRVADLAPTLSFSVHRRPKGDSIQVDLVLQNTKEEPLAHTDFTYHTLLNKRSSARRKGQTNTQGQSQIRFFLPDGKDRQNAQLVLTVLQDKIPVQKFFQIPLATDTLDVQFFPEGGQMVAGMVATVGFKAVNGSGLGEEVTGAVHEDQTGKKVVDLQSLKYGMGRFKLFLEKGKTYSARLKTATGPEKAFPLPAAQEKGVVMTVDNTGAEKIGVRAFLVGFQEGEDKPKAVSVVAQSGGQVYFAAHAASPKELVRVEIPSQNLPSGVAQITLFSETGTPLAERLVFINHNEQLQLHLTPTKTTYRPREKVTMRLQAKTHNGQPVAAGHFSVAVTDASKVEQNSLNGSILSYLLLSSDLRGHIEQPGYYFSSAEPEVALALDNLMLTQGWRRFTWQDVLAETYPKLTQPLERSLAVSGTVLKLSGKPEPHAVLTVMGLGKAGFMLLDTTDAQGKFMIGLNLQDSTRVVVQARTQKGRAALEVVLDHGVPLALRKPRAPYFPSPAPLSDLVWNYLQTNRQQLRLDQLAGKSILLNAVQIKGRKQTQEDEDRWRSGIHGSADVTLKGADLGMGMNPLMALQGRVAGLQVMGNQVSMRGAGEPLFLLDGMPVEVDFIQSVSMSEVEKIEIVKPGPMAAIYGSRGGNGVIAVTLKRGGSGGSTSTRYRGMAVYRGPTFHAARQFYHPRYDVPQKIETPDLRTTLFWSPNVQTDSTGSAEFSFFAADAVTTYHAQVEGLTASGALGKGTVQVQVRQ